jgi:hypothetical protein
MCLPDSDVDVGVSSFWQLGEKEGNVGQGMMVHKTCRTIWRIDIRILDMGVNSQSPSFHLVDNQCPPGEQTREPPNFTVVEYYDASGEWSNRKDYCRCCSTMAWIGML